MTAGGEAAAPQERLVEFDSERTLGAILTVFRRGAGDPTFRSEGYAVGRFWVAWQTLDGPVTARLSQLSDRRITVAAWGRGRGWFLEQVPALLGRDDDVGGFTPRHPVVAEAWRRFTGWRVPSSGLVVQALVPTVIEQKVTGKEAFAGYRTLVRRYGEPAPGPGAELGLVVPPDATTWARIPSWDWLRASVDGARSATIMRALVSPARLEECGSIGLPAAHRRLRSVPGVGVWTAAEVAHRALGDADAVSFGDYHVAKNIGYVLTGAEVDDDGLAELLEPYAGHRYRVQRLLELAGLGRPRRGPRMAPRTHLPR